MRFENTDDRRSSRQAADFVINTAAVKSHHHQKDLRGLTAKHGYYYGGVSLGSFYNFELMMDVTRDGES